MDFTLNLKAFLKQLPRGMMSGHQKFLAVAAVLCKGDDKAEVEVAQIRKQWPKTLLGIKHNPVFYGRAQGAGWVNPTGTKGKFRVTQKGLENLEALVPEFTAAELKKSGSLTIFKKGATHTFDKFLRTTLAAAKSQVLIADSWVDGTIFDTVLDVIPKDCTFKLMYAKPRDQFAARAKRFSKQYNKFAYKKYAHLHDRFMIVDEVGFVLGPSIKDAASNSPAVVVTLGAKEKTLLQGFFSELWGKAQ